jgi:hypothetical protein
MKKLYKFKKWYGINEAAERLSIALGEKVTNDDIVDFIIEEQLSLFWDIRSRYAVPVIYEQREFHHSEKDNLLLNHNKPSDKNPDKIISEGFFPLQEDRIAIAGIYKIETQSCGETFIDYLKALRSKEDYHSVFIQDFYVSDKNRQIFRIVASYSNKLINGLKSKGAYYPVGEDKSYKEFPTYSELGFTKECIEEFEAKLTEHEKHNTSYKKQINSLMKIVITMAIKGYVYDPKAKKSQIVSDIKSDMNLLGLNLDEDTIREWLKKSAELLPPQEDNQ